MKTDSGNFTRTDYEAPEVTLIMIEVEKGFSSSIIGNGNESYEGEDGNWDVIL